MKLTFRHIHQITELAKQASFAKAALELHISQPALSRSISTLEEQLGVQLFDRSKKKVIPTLFGKHILERGKPILQEMTLVERDLDLLQGMESGKLVIGSGPFPAETSLGKSVAQFSRNHPKMNVQIIIDYSAALLTRLREREIDIFIADIRALEETSDLEIIPLSAQQAYFCSRHTHPLTRKNNLMVKDIFSYPLAVMWLPEKFLISLARESNIQVNSVYDLPCSIIQCDYLKVLFDIISESDAIGIITRSISEFHNKQQLALLPLSIPELNTNYGLVSLANYSKPPALQRFQQYMIEQDNCISRN
jgi:DNA-binding transcriptional LysR family regulator